MLTESSISEAVAAEAVKAVCILPPELEEKLKEASADSAGLENKVLSRILENIEAAAESGVPLCQDTGVFEIWVRAGKNSPSAGVNISGAVEQGIRKAHEEGPLRNSMSELRPVVHIETTDSDKIDFLMTPRGFGSENYTFLHMMPPGTDFEGIKELAAADAAAARSRPCPPYIIGIGIGGTASKAVELSARALAECDFNHSPQERQILEVINAAGTGAGGVGGRHTAVGVKIMEFPRHIAGLPVAVHIGCWCNRVRRFSL